MSIIEANTCSQIVPYVERRDKEPDDVPETSVGLLYHDAPGEPNVEQIGRLRRWRKRKTMVAGVGLGVVLLIFMGPIGGVAGGIVGAYATKRALKRREKKVVDRLMAMQYPLVYNRNAVFA